MQRQQGLWWPSSWLWDCLWVPLSLLALKEFFREDPTGWHLLSHYTTNMNKFQMTIFLRHRYNFPMFFSLYLVHSWVCKLFKVYSIDNKRIYTLYIWCMQTYGTYIQALSHMHCCPCEQKMSCTHIMCMDISRL